MANHEVPKADLLYEGKAKKVYRTDDPALCIIEYKDDATAFNAEKRGVIENKGIYNNKISEHFFLYLARHGLATHYVRRLNDREALVRSVEIIPLEVVVRNIVAGSLAKRLGIEEGTPLKDPVVEFYYKDDALGDPLVTRSHVRILKVATDNEMDHLEREALRINDLLQAFLSNLNIALVDFKLEFGRIGQTIVLADEISPDTCRFWDSSSGERLDKDRFRRDLGGVEEAYSEILRRLEGSSKN